MHADVPPKGNRCANRFQHQQRGFAGLQRRRIVRLQDPKARRGPRRDGIDKSLKQVYASLWNFRAFIERDFHRVDHLGRRDGRAGAPQLHR